MHRFEDDNLSSISCKQYFHKTFARVRSAQIANASAIPNSAIHVQFCKSFSFSSRFPKNFISKILNILFFIYHFFFQGNIKVYSNILHPDVEFKTLCITSQTTRYVFFLPWRIDWITL